MNIELKEIKVRDLTKGYEDNQEDGVIGYDGKLDIRPPYQREFIYKDKIPLKCNVLGSKRRW